MTELNKLIEDIKNGNFLLSELLLRAHALVLQLKNENLSTWIDNELNGYSDSSSAPKHRIVPCIVRGVISNGLHQQKIIYPADTSSDKLNKKLKHCEILVGVSELEELANGASISQPLPTSAIARLNEVLDNGYEAQTAFREVTKAQVKQILITIRQKLLEKLLTIEINQPVNFPERSKGIINTTIEIFISHSSRDTELVDKFVDHILVLGFGLDKKKIFCSSISGMNVKSGKDFKETIYQKLKEAKMVIQLITQNYKSSEVCLNEMGAAWVLSSFVIPIVANPFNYDVGFIHHTTQQLKLNSSENIHQLYDDYKGEVFSDKVSTVELNKQINIFVDFVEKYVSENSERQENIFFYNEESSVTGTLHSGIFGHPPLLGEGKLEDHTSFHRYYFLVLNPSIDVLSNELPASRGNSFDVSYFNVGRLQIFNTDKVKIDLKKYVGKKIEVKGKFMGSHTAWHRTNVLLEFSEIKLI